AVHAGAPTAADTDWSQIVSLYDHLLALRPNVVVAVNRAVAVSEHQGPEAGLDALAGVDADAADAYQGFHATRADLLRRTGRTGEAVAAYDRALALTTNPAEAEFLRGQRDEAAGRPG
ncbi:MAG TPA: hypothetical protein VFV42_03805, partial [Acidimicrobiales bacterium]|nr:hypothetical protein [Acidimicrobiales bacterium]